MSRISRDWIWSEWIGDLVDETVCLCCKQSKINRLPVGKDYNWEKGHIIPSKKDPINNKKPSDFVENIWPICKNCNEYDRKYPTNLHYACHLGTISKEKADEMLVSIRDVLENRIVRTCAKGGCKYTAHGKAMYCRTHESGVTPKELYNYLINLQLGIREKVRKLQQIEKDPLWADEKEYIRSYEIDLINEMKTLKAFGFEVLTKS